MAGAFSSAFSSSFDIGGGTKLYFPSTGSAAIARTPSADWEDTTTVFSVARPLKTTPSGTAMTTLSIAADLSGALVEDVLFYQGISLPLNGDQTISAQTIRLAVRGDEFLITDDLFLAVGARVVSNDGTAVRGTLFAVTLDNTELATSLTDRYFTVTSSSVSALSGDRIVVEFGVHGGVLTTHVSDLRVGDAAASDLPFDDATTTDLNPYIQFSQTLLFSGEGGGMSGASGMAFGAGASTLSGAGALVGTQALAFGAGVTALAGAGALAASGAMTFGEGGTTLLGAGALAGTAAAVFGEGVTTLQATGSIAGTATILVTATGSLLGTGVLAGTGAMSFGAGSATLAGAGVLSGQATLVFSEGGALDLPSGQMEGTDATLFTPTGAVLGTGALAGLAVLMFSGAGVVVSPGVLAGAAAMTFTAAGVLASDTMAGLSATAFVDSGALLATGAMAGLAAMTFTDVASIASGAVGPGNIYHGRAHVRGVHVGAAFVSGVQIGTN